MITKPEILGGLVLVSVFCLASCASSGGRKGSTESDCEDYADNDGDQLTDCDDPDCSDEEFCVRETDCANTLDDEEDGFTDCEDLDCVNDPACVTEGYSCHVLSMCYFCCATGDTDCHQTCDAATSSAGLAQMGVLLDCASQHCGTDCVPVWNCYQCTMDHCKPALENCGLPATGQDNCLTLFGCTEPLVLPHGTGDATSCPVERGILDLEECFRRADRQATDLFLTAYFCVLEKCYDVCYANHDNAACNACSLNDCQTEVTECLGDDQ